MRAAAGGGSRMPTPWSAGQPPRQHKRRYGALGIGGVFGAAASCAGNGTALSTG